MLLRSVILGLAFGLNATTSLFAQQHFNLPTMNALGRVFGIGWNAGYHSGPYDGRFQFIKDAHPASNYASQGLLYPYHPSYTAAQLGHQPVLYSQPTLATPLPASQSTINVQGKSQSILQNSEVVPAPKPVDPPPSWLRPYLKDESKAQDSAGETDEAVELMPAEELEEPSTGEPSPSDQPKPKVKVNTKESDDDDLLIPAASLTPIQRYHQALQNTQKKR